MKFNGNIESQEDIKSYIEEVAKKEDEIIDELLKVFKETTDFWIKNKIAMFLRKYDNDKIPEAFIEEIKKPESKNYDGTIVDCSSYFDCTKHFRFFIDIVLNDNTESYLWAMEVIGRMDGPFKLSELNAAIELLQSAINEKQHPDKIPYYAKLLNFLLEEKVNNVVT